MIIDAIKDGVEIFTPREKPVSVAIGRKKELDSICAKNIVDVTLLPLIVVRMGGK